MEIRVPSLTSVTALTNIYLLLSLCAVTVYGTKKPTGRIYNDNPEDRDDNRTKRSDKVIDDVIKRVKGEKSVQYKSKFASRSLDSYYDYEQELFQPSVQLQEYSEEHNQAQQKPSQRRKIRRRRPVSQRRRDNNGYQQLGQRYTDTYSNRQNYKSDPQYGQGYVDNYEDQAYRHSYNVPGQILSHQRQSVRLPSRKQSFSRFPTGRPEVNIQYPDYDEQGITAEKPKPSKSAGLLSTLFSLIRPNKPVKVKSEQSEPSEPSYEFVYNNEIDTGEDKASLFQSQDSDLFIPNNGDYDDYNLNYIDGEEEEEEKEVNLPDYDFKDVLHSIKNNESRILTLKKFLSAASGLTDRAGTDPVFMLWSMPLTILSILGVFYAVAAIGVLGYKYLLLTTGNTNGQAVAILPVAILFTAPLIMATIFLLGRGIVDGQINLGGLARGDLNRVFRQDFDSIDFIHDLGLGATAILGLGWIVSVTV